MRHRQPPNEPTESEINWHFGHMCHAAFATAFPEEVAAEHAASEQRRQEANAFDERIRTWARTDEAAPLIDVAYANSFPFPKPTTTQDE